MMGGSKSIGDSGKNLIIGQLNCERGGQKIMVMSFMNYPLLVYSIQAFLSTQDSKVGIMYLMLIKASGPPRFSNTSRVSWIKSPTLVWNLW